MSFIEHLNLTEDEKKIYAFLLNFGNLTAIELANFAGKNFQTVINALNSLIEKGAVGETKGYIKKYFARIPLSYLGEKSSNISNQINENLTKATSSLTNEKEKLTELATKTKTVISEEIERKKKSLDSQMNTKKDEIHSNISEIKEEDSNKIAEIRSQMGEDINSLKDEITSELRDSTGKALESISTSKKSIADSKTELITNLENNSAKIIEETATSVKTKSDDINNAVSNLQPKLEELKATYVKEFDEISNITKTNFDLARLDLKEFNDKQATKTIDYSQNITTELGKTLDNATVTVKSHLDTLNNNLENLLNTKTEEMVLKIKETLASLSNEIEAIKGDLVAEMVQQKSAVLASTLLKIKDELAIKFTEFSNEEQRRKQEFMSEKDIFSQKLDAYYNETIDEFTKKIEEIKTNAEQKVSSINSKALAEFTSLSEQIVSILSEHQETFSKKINDIKSTISEELEKNANVNNETLSNIENMLKAIIETNSTKIEDLYEKTKTTIETQTKIIQEAILSTVDKIVNDTLETAKALVSISKGEIDKTKNFIEEMIEKEIENSFGIMEETHSNLENLAKELMSVSVKLGEDFQTLEAKTTAVKEPEINTTAIIGVDAVEEHIKEILKNVQRKGTLFVPTKRSVPVEVLKALKGTVQITVVTKIDEEMDKEWINDLLNNTQANIMIRTIREGGLGGGMGTDMPVIYAVERDSSEVLVAIEDETTKEVVGILSNSTEFAKVLSYTILSNYLSGAASRQIR
ncbi:MAG: hypothetical protein K9W45_07240 [Candidatus Heimdallarchaeum aukensis]|uniref:Transcription regulator TrmB N-terminal domain-containing protein n=1 Tax=Candidatus Heimdallarchaeum aukensis TaxID=2876573 RepID=A0A9Y1FIQ3_9ARCH|nr:MAG: hypothetical protein K9W45_07240 [Candidatus Heimdallarchaeum aukensis]